VNLVTDTPNTLSSIIRGTKVTRMQEWFSNRWTRISLKAQDKNVVFNNLLAHIRADTLLEAFKALDGTRALGIDGVSKADYGRNLQANLENLEKRIHKGTYRPKLKREVLIPKAKGKTRPIAIACFEDKLVDWAVGKILALVYEPLFIRTSFGYRPNKSAHGAIEACYNSLCRNARKYVVEIDFSSFFNSIPHRKLMDIISKRISDQRFKGLIGRFLKGRLITKEEIISGKIGTPQGSIMSPILANIFLNEAVDQWFMEKHAWYSNVIVRYADDAAFFFTCKEEAAEFLKELRIRSKDFGLTLNEDKTQSLNMAKNQNNHFSFLGFTFYWGKQGSRRIFKIKTQKEKLVKSMQDFERWIKSDRNKGRLKDIWALAKTKVQGHINYFGYWMNALKINHFIWSAIKSLYKWLNRRSQKRSYNWGGFSERLKNHPLVKPLKEMRLKRLGNFNA
jgi:RNA-directed DNA polymerase